MATVNTSTGSTARRAPTERRTRERRAGCSAHSARNAVIAAVAAASFAGPAVAQDPSPLPPERAFAYSVRALDAGVVEARFAIAGGYYLYRDKLKFGLEPGGLASPPVLPPGTVKEDPFFGKVETYRGQVVVRLALGTPAPGSTVTVSAESQGCADIGICYPVQLQKVAVALPAAGAGPGVPVEAAPAKKSWFK
jgi:thiol:disulfide interchange protein DsbD